MTKGDAPGISDVARRIDILVGDQDDVTRCPQFQSTEQAAGIVGSLGACIGRNPDRIVLGPDLFPFGQDQGVNVPPRWFFHDLGDTATVKAPIPPDAIAEGDDLARRETLPLIRASNRIRDSEKRERLVELIQAAGDAEVGETAVLKQ